MVRLSLLFVAASCLGETPSQPLTAGEHMQLAHSYDATAASIEHECFKNRSHELTVTDPNPCWKAQDVRFLEANRNAADAHRAAAMRLRAQQAAQSASR
jgi:hypothetical protein